jgi:hypothetical protein
MTFHLSQLSEAHNFRYPVIVLWKNVCNSKYIALQLVETNGLHMHKIVLHISSMNGGEHY